MCIRNWFWVIGWVGPLPSSHHQDDYNMFSLGFQPKPSFATISGKGGSPSYSRIACLIPKLLSILANSYPGLFEHFPPFRDARMEHDNYRYTSYMYDNHVVDSIWDQEVFVGPNTYSQSIWKIKVSKYV